METILRDTRMALRRLGASPGFTFFSVISLALGVAATTATFSFVSSTLWKSSAIADEREIAVIVRGSPAAAKSVSGGMAKADFDLLRPSLQSFSSVAAAQTVFSSVVTPEVTVLARGEGVLAQYFETLKLEPALGRLLLASDISAASQTVVLGHSLWRTRFGGDPAIVGRVIRIGAIPFEVVGVTPDGFQGVLPGRRGAELWVPHSALPYLNLQREASAAQLTVFGRLRSGIAASTAAAELASLSRSEGRLQKGIGDANSPSPSWTVRPLIDLDLSRQTRFRAGLITLALVAMVLLVSSTNLANLTLARAAPRRHELIIRGALGASRSRLIYEQLLETVLIALTGAGLSYLLLRFFFANLQVELPTGPGSSLLVELQVDLRAVLVSGGLTLLSLGVFGLLPAFRLTRRGAVLSLSNSAIAGHGPRAVKGNRTILRWQVAVSAGFFVISAMCIRMLVADAQHDSGVDLRNLAVAVVNFRAQDWDEPRARHAMQRLLEQGQSSPDLDAVAVSTGLPFGTSMTPSATLSRPGDSTASTARQEAELMGVSAAYFRAAGTRILRGRPFGDEDQANTTPVIIVSESAARSLFGTTDVIGRQVLLKTNSKGLRQDETDRMTTIVGVSANTDTGFYAGHRGHTAYVPLAHDYFPIITILARSTADANPVGKLQRIVLDTDSQIALERVAEARLMLAGPYVVLRAVALVALFLGALTLGLAMAGLYGVQTFLIQQRARELGTRAALGASPRQVQALVFREGFAPVVQGVAVGLFIGIMGRAIVRSAVLSTEGILVDAWILIVIPAVLLTSVVACYLPARRAARVDPSVALRYH